MTIDPPLFNETNAPSEKILPCPYCGPLSLAYGDLCETCEGLFLILNASEKSIQIHNKLLEILPES